jgi:hypothetical protein
MKEGGDEGQQQQQHRPPFIIREKIYTSLRDIRQFTTEFMPKLNYGRQVLNLFRVLNFFQKRKRWVNHSIQ